MLAFTDLVGFSALAQRDERAALAMLDAHRLLVREILPAHRGSEIKTIGDAFLLEFPSVLEALACLLACQQRHREHNAGASTPIAMRAGLHIGDVERRDGDVLGDTVNLVARIQDQAPAGGIAISEQIQAQIRSRPEYATLFHSIGRPALKNISTPVELFVWDPDQARLSKPSRAGDAAASSPWAWTARRALLLALAAVVVAAVALVARRDVVPPAEVVVDTPPVAVPAAPSAPSAPSAHSIAVLPFVNMSSDAEQEYFSDGLTEELLHALAGISALQVTARTSSFAFKGKNMPVRDIGTALGVANILEGSVRRSGRQLRITAQLVRAADGFHYWSRVYDRPLDDVFAVQEEIARAVAAEMRLTLLGTDETRLAGRGTSNLEAYDEYLKGLSEFNAESGAAMLRAMAHFERALTLDPGFQRPYYRLYLTYGKLKMQGLWATSASWEARRRIVERALQTGAAWSELEAMRGHLAAARGAPVSELKAHYEEALRLDPHNSYAGWNLILAIFSGQERVVRELEFHQGEIQRDPLSPSAYGPLLDSYLALGRLDAAASASSRLKELAPGSAWGFTYAAEIALARGDAPAAYIELVRAHRADPASAQPYDMMSRLLFRLGDVDEARRLSGLVPLVGYANYSHIDIALADGDPERTAAVRQAFVGTDDFEMPFVIDMHQAIARADWEAAAGVVVAVGDAARKFDVQRMNGTPSLEDYGWYLLDALISARRGDTARATRILGLLEPLLATPGVESGALEFARVNALAVAGKESDALALLRGLVDRGLRPGMSDANIGFSVVSGLSSFWTLPWNPFLIGLQKQGAYQAVAAELDARAARARAQIAAWKQSNPELATPWTAPAQP